MEVLNRFVLQIWTLTLCQRWFNFYSLRYQIIAPRRHQLPGHFALQPIWIS